MDGRTSHGDQEQETLSASGSGIRGELMENIMNVDNWVLMANCAWKLWTIWWPVVVASCVWIAFTSWNSERPV